MLRAVKQSDKSLLYVVPEAKADRELTFEAVEQNETPLLYGAPEVNVETYGEYAHISFNDDCTPKAQEVCYCTRTTAWAKYGLLQESKLDASYKEGRATCDANRLGVVYSVDAGSADQLGGRMKQNPKTDQTVSREVLRVVPSARTLAEQVVMLRAKRPSWW